MNKKLKSNTFWPFNLRGSQGLHKLCMCLITACVSWIAQIKVWEATTRQQPGQGTADKQRGKKKGKRIKMRIPIKLFLRKYLWREVMSGSTENYGGTKWSNVRPRTWPMGMEYRLQRQTNFQRKFTIHRIHYIWTLYGQRSGQGQNPTNITIRVNFFGKTQEMLQSLVC